MNALLTFLALGFGDTPSPPLHCPTPLAAKGDIKGGPPLAHTFELTNRGSGTLNITQVIPSCGCIRRTLSQATLKPGETAKLTLEINTLTQPDGANRWPVTIGYSYAGAAPALARNGEIMLAITAKITRQVTVTPPQLAFSTTAGAEQLLTVADRRGKPLRIVKATTTSPHLSAEIAAPRLVAGIQSQAIALKLAAAAPPGHRDEMLILQTDDPEYPEFRVPVRVLKKAAGAVQAHPDAIAVRFAAGQKDVSTLLQLRSPDGKKVRIAAAEADSPALAVKFAAGSASAATVRIATSGKAIPAGSGFVKIHLVEPTVQDVLIPVSWSQHAP
jgi:hypothetical protein